MYRDIQTYDRLYLWNVLKLCYNKAWYREAGSFFFPSILLRCYWHLDTRPDEHRRMSGSGWMGRLKLAARAIDLRLKAVPRTKDGNWSAMIWSSYACFWPFCTVVRIWRHMKGRVMGTLHLNKKMEYLFALTREVWGSCDRGDRVPARGFWQSEFHTDAEVSTNLIIIPWF